MSSEFLMEHETASTAHPLGDSIHGLIGTSGAKTSGWATVHVDGNWNDSGDSGPVAMTIKKKVGVPLQIMFKAIKKKTKAMTSMEKIALDRRIEALDNMALHAIDNGQMALSEDCIRLAEIAAQEAGIYAFGIRNYIREVVLNKFIEYCTDGRDVLKTPVEEFTRVMPPDVQKRLRECRKRNLFTNYIVVHYDPGLESVSADEKKTIEKKRDPILFGTIDASDRLYLIADWIDEYCDLTFDEILGALRISEDVMMLDRKPTLIPDQIIDPEKLERILIKRKNRRKKKTR